MLCSRRIALAIAVTFTTNFASGIALAAEPGETNKTPTPHVQGRPWADGVSQAEQNVALALFQEGTALLKDAFFTKAVEKYREALDHWNHPAIHFNLAKALMNLDQPVEAFKSLDESMKFGGAPLDEDQIDQVKRYMKLLYDAELSELVIEAKEEGAIVSLNGVELFMGPGRWQGLVRADKNTILATKPGYQPAQEQRNLPKGQKTEITLTLVAVESVTKYTRVMDAWKPWLVVGSGAAALIAGGIFSWQSSSSFSDYDKAIEVCSSSTATPILDGKGNDTGGKIFGCRPTAAIKDKQSNGELFNTLATVSYIAGGATLATGIVLLYINRERPIQVEVPVVTPVSVVPIIGPDGAGVSATMRF